MWGLTRVWCNEQVLEDDMMFGENSDNPVQLAPLPGIEPINCAPAQNQALFDNLMNKAVNKAVNLLTLFRTLLRKTLFRTLSEKGKIY